MTTEASQSAPVDDLPIPPGLTDGLDPTQPLKYLLESARSLSAMIPEEEHKASRARMVAYLDEVAAREPSRQPGTQSE